MKLYPPTVVNKQVTADISLRQIDTDKLDPEALKAFDGANLSVGQIWKSKRQGSDIKITYLGRNVAGVKFEELDTGKIGAFCIEIFLERFSYKGNG